MKYSNRPRYGKTKYTKRSRKPRINLKNPFRKMPVYMPIQCTQKTVTNIYDTYIEIDELPLSGSFYPQPGLGSGVGPIDDWENTDNQFYSHALYFQLNQISDVSRFVNLFDKFRVRRVTCQLIPQFNVNQVQPTADIQMNNATTGITYDYDDAVAIKSYEGLLSRQKVKISTALRPWKYSIKPRIGIATNDSAIGQVQKADQWLSTEDSQDVAHFGIKYGHYYFNALQAYETYHYQLITTYTLEFKDVKDLFADETIED